MLTEKCIQFHREWAKKAMLEKPKRYGVRNSILAMERQRELRKDPQFKLKDNVSRAMRLAMHGNKAGRSWEKLVGYSVGELKIHLEKQFSDGMDWNNYGSYWHVDHKVPLSWFGKQGMDKSFAIVNLQPLLASVNCAKGNKYVS
jgi:hypothetical protein